jgi:hypothetical protein
MDDASRPASRPTKNTPGLTSWFKPFKPAIEIRKRSFQHLPARGVLGGTQLRENGLPR